jgi:hypothetical protein
MYTSTGALPKMKRVQSGSSTSDLLFSSHQTNNQYLFPKILDLYVENGSRIADLTYGKGVFWREVELDKYETFFSDIQTGVDSRRTHYDDSYFDCVVFDPPYMEGLYRQTSNQMAGSSSHSAFRDRYSDSLPSVESKRKYHDRVLEMYIHTGVEVDRILKNGGIYIVKCQDEVSANRQKLTHVEIIYGMEQIGFYCKDLFVITRNNSPSVSRVLKQEHSRKNHSYFLVFQKVKNRYTNIKSVILEMIEESRSTNLDSILSPQKESS